ncbi:uncharacterized protein V1510DRAFT_156157 [Dipodascopsis tothii]|uniref:uncharacterized protein n=1 Tax=Dipodascopsis tothii TaxID=44089 RepID=UPI0034CF007F
MDAVCSLEVYAVLVLMINRCCAAIRNVMAGGGRPRHVTCSCPGNQLPGPGCGSHVTTRHAPRVAHRLRLAIAGSTLPCCARRLGPFAAPPPRRYAPATRHYADDAVSQQISCRPSTCFYAAREPAWHGRCQVGSAVLAVHWPVAKTPSAIDSRFQSRRSVLVSCGDRASWAGPSQQPQTGGRRTPLPRRWCRDPPLAAGEMPGRAGATVRRLRRLRRLRGG